MTHENYCVDNAKNQSTNPESALPDPAAAWSKYAEALADWTFARIVVRQDVHGRHRPDGTRYTERATPLDRELLVRHYKGNLIIGVHDLSVDNRCKRVLADIDAHDDDNKADLDLNWRTALRIAKLMQDVGLHPLIFDSNGKGGYWISAFFKKPISAAAAYQLGVGIKSYLAAEGMAKIEWFPKQPKLSIDCPYGNWTRLPGRHHKRDHWTRIYDPAQGRWIDGEAAVRRLLQIAGDDTKTILEAYAQHEAKVASNGQPRSKKKNKRRRSEGEDRATEEDLREALKCLPDSWTNDYGGETGNTAWLGTGMALQDWDPLRGLNLWKEFSARSAK
jgi:hypothetical protein